MTATSDADKFRADVLATWNGSPQYQAEFPTFDAFFAYTKALTQGRIQRVRRLGEAVQRAGA